LPAQQSQQQVGQVQQQQRYAQCLMEQQRAALEAAVLVRGVAVLEGLGPGAGRCSGLAMALGRV
jgi:hypothetical protein